jgi:hypothetical protein
MVSWGAEESRRVLYVEPLLEVAKGEEEGQEEYHQTAQESAEFQSLFGILGVAWVWSQMGEVPTKAYNGECGTKHAPKEYAVGVAQT